MRIGENPTQTTAEYSDNTLRDRRTDLPEPGIETDRNVPTRAPSLTALPDDHSDELEPSPREECGVFGVWAPARTSPA